MITIKTYRGHIRNWEALSKELGLDVSAMTREEREQAIIIKAYETWGKNLADHFYGMFAFALWDDDAQELFCLRDQFGTKPFYYYLTEDNQLLYGTFIRDIINQKGFVKEINKDMLQIYMTLTYVAGEDTFFKGLKKLMPAHYLVFKNGKIELTRYWKPE
ncbi:MAG: asparagine synthetase B, partial [Oscillospiraceae bacterium]|nr:asparagine synthetase B [Oscillospiraceae bacterium]